MTLDDWSTAIKLPIKETQADFKDIEEFDLKTYDQIVGQMAPPPRYTLTSFYFDTPLTPTHIQLIKHIKISVLDISAQKNLVSYSYLA